MGSAVGTVVTLRPYVTSILGRIRHGGTRHAGETRELAKERLVGHLGNYLALLANFDTLHGLDTLVQSIAPPTSIQHASRERVNDSNTAVVRQDSILDILSEQLLGLDSVKDERRPRS